VDERLALEENQGHFFESWSCQLSNDAKRPPQLDNFFPIVASIVYARTVVSKKKAKKQQQANKTNRYISSRSTMLTKFYESVDHLSWMTVSFKSRIEYFSFRGGILQLGLWIDETLIICDFSSDDSQNFISDDDTKEFL
jgi:hypothetical protein